MNFFRIFRYDSTKKSETFGDTRKAVRFLVSGLLGSSKDTKISEPKKKVISSFFGMRTLKWAIQFLNYQQGKLKLLISAVQYGFNFKFLLSFNIRKIEKIKNLKKLKSEKWPKMAKRLNFSQARHPHNKTKKLSVAK